MISAAKQEVQAATFGNSRMKVSVQVVVQVVILARRAEMKGVPSLP